MMKKYFFLIALGCMVTLRVFSQGSEIDKLVFLYIDEKYEKCVNKGKGLTENDKYRKEPLPYLYVSMSLYEISKTDELVEKYPKAFKDAMKYAYKYRKKDKNLEYAGKHKDYIVTLKDSANSLGQLYYKTEDYRKAAYMYKNIYRFDPDAHLMRLWQGICEIKSRNIGEGERNLVGAMEKIDENFVPDKVELGVASLGMTEYANYMDTKGDYAAVRMGKKLAEKFKEYDPEVIRQKELEAAKKEEPVREKKSFGTTEEDMKNQKASFIGSDKEGVEDAKKEIEKITDEENKVKKFSSDQ